MRRLLVLLAVLCGLGWGSSAALAYAAFPTEAARAAPNRLQVKIGVPLARKDNGFDIYEAVAIMGQQIKMSATDSSAGCQAICRNTPGCFAATYNDFCRGKNVACQVYREVTDSMRAPPRR